MPLLDLDQLRSFIAIVDSGGFTRAASHVNKTQSAISVQIRKLEETLGKPLFAKQGRTMRLTADGERLVDQARRLLALNNQIVTSMASPSLSGSIRIGTPVYAERYFPVIFASFARVYPNVTIDILSHESHRLAEELDRGNLDLALVTHASTHQRGEVIRMEQLYWVASPDFDLEAQDPIPVAMYHTASALRNIAIDALDAVGIRYRVAYTSASNDALTGALKAGLAVGVLPGCAMSKKLRIIGKDDGFPALPQFAISLIEGANAGEAHIKAMAEHIKLELSNLPAGPSMEVSAPMFGFG